MTTKINAKKGELVNLVNGLFSVQELKGKKFSLIVLKNIKALKKELKELEVAGKPTEEFLKLAHQVNEIANENSDDSEAKILALEEDNKELVEGRRKQIEKVTSMMEVETTVELKTISEDILPDDITPKQLSSIEQIII
jgi:dGTP triphosphohydrolase